MTFFVRIIMIISFHLFHLKLYCTLRTIFCVYLQVELVGASLTATFSEQSIQWPPYRIINRTSLTLRYKQQIIPDYGISDILFPVYPSDTVQKNVQNSAVRTRANSHSSSNYNDEKDDELLPWETMNAK
jgi:hypothetical protein